MGEKEQKLTIFQQLREQLVIDYSHIPKTTIDKVLDFQWKIAYKAFSNPDNMAIELTGLGTFTTRVHKLKKKLQQLYDSEAACEKNIAAGTGSNMEIKLAGIKKDIIFVKHKLSKNQTNES